MPELLLTLAASAMCCLGCAMLALSQREHWTAAGEALPYPPARVLRKLRAVAFLMLVGALGPCIAGHGAGFGLLLWVLLLGAGGIGAAFVLAWRAHWLVPLVVFLSRSA